MKEDKIKEAFIELYKDSLLSLDNLDSPLHPLHMVYQGFKSGWESNPAKWTDDDMLNAMDNHIDNDYPTKISRQKLKKEWLEEYESHVKK